MSLQSHGKSTIPNAKKYQPSNPRNPISSSDILGSTVTSSEAKYSNSNKPNSYYNTDILGSTSKPLTRNYDAGRGVDYTLKIDDIDGARPRGSSYKNARNPVDPLAPDYVLPSYSKPVDVDVYLGRRVRDNLDVTDISGTKSKPLYAYAKRENISCSDIEGARTGWKPRHVQEIKDGIARDLMRVDDINNKALDKFTRTTDPLRPSHYIHGRYVQDDMVTSKPRLLPAHIKDTFKSLTTSDIPGSYTGWIPPHALQPGNDKRRHFVNTNYVGDIVGCTADTVQKAIRTMRVVDPLQPKYRYLDGDLGSGGDTARSGAGNGDGGGEGDKGRKYVIPPPFGGGVISGGREKREAEDALNSTIENMNQLESRDRKVLKDQRDVRIKELEEQVTFYPEQQNVNASASARKPETDVDEVFKRSFSARSGSGSNNNSGYESARSARSGNNGNDTSRSSVVTARSNRSDRSDRSYNAPISHRSQGNSARSAMAMSARSREYNADVQSVRDL